MPAVQKEKKSGKTLTTFDVQHKKQYQVIILITSGLRNAPYSVNIECQRQNRQERGASLLFC